MEALDHILFGLEVLLLPLSLGLLLAAAGLGRGVPPLWLALVGSLGILAYLGSPWSLVLLVPAAGIVLLVGRLADSRPRLRALAVPLAIFVALTVAQPFGVEAERLDLRPSEAPPQGEAVDPTSTQSEEIAGISLLRFQLYRRDKFDPLAGLGECCPPTHELQIRSWVPPLLMTNADTIFGLGGDAPSWDPDHPRTRGNVRLLEKDGDWYVTVRERGFNYAWRLSAGVVSRLGAIYWILAALGIGAVVFRRRWDRPR